MIIRHIHSAQGEPITEALYSLDGSNRCARLFGWLSAEQVRDVLAHFRKVAA